MEVDRLTTRPRDGAGPRLFLPDNAYKMDGNKHELRAEMQSMGRSLTLSLVTMMTIINGIVFTALTFAFR